MCAHSILTKPRSYARVRGPVEVTGQAARGQRGHKKEVSHVGRLA
ncbi:MAG: hypothetical protein UY77_C0002G0014 [Candidatus Uhrbacteria bacterium GW2011_GWA2_53_10]|uniref:Uncharacterized protein n=1 Tax=Candidatus Uhrbacteria bacterium GW2011_GWA2_53_10 TaxID=1618980 RepID=A0A0G1XQR3_9BACT|nr:MAG: hypothetical protein UY77_C0002G0014 [Candidatus Uhrbacteria bacterium GW2011_GWA2_53_10]